MARVVLGGIGAFLGNLILPGIGGAIGWGLGSALGNALFPQQLPPVVGPRLSDLRAQVSQYGTPIPVIYGTMRVPTRAIWMPDYIEVKKTKKEGGKGGGGEQKVTTYEYFFHGAFEICEGPIDGVRRVWADGKLIFDASETNLGPVGGSHWQAYAGAGATLINGKPMRIYLGTEDQMPDPLIQSYEGADSTPAYRGKAYLVFERFAMRDYGNRPPIITVEVVRGGTSFPTATFAHNSGREGDSRQHAFPGLWYDAYTDGMVVAAYNFDDTPSWCDITVFERDGSVRFTYAQSKSDTSDHHITVHEGVLWNCDGTAVNRLDLTTGVALGDPDPSATSKVALCYCPNTNRVWAWTRTGSDRILFYDGDTLEYLGNQTVSYGPSDEHVPVWVPSREEMWAYDNNVVYRHDETGALLGSFAMSGGNAAAAMVYDAVTDAVWISMPAGTTYKVECATLSVSSGISTPGARNVAIDNVENRAVWVNTSNEIKAIDLTTLAVSTLATGIGSSGAGGKWHAFNTIQTGLWNRGTSAASPARRTLLDRVASEGQGLDEIVSDLCARVGLEELDIDVSDLTADTVAGFGVQQRGQAAGPVDQLRTAYAFDVVESSGLLRFIKRGGAVVASIPYDELGASEMPSEEARLTSERRQEIELPQVVEVVYLDPAAKYEQAVQRATRQITPSEERLAVELPLVASADFAVQMAHRLMFETWWSRTTRRFALSRKYLRLDPADPIEVEDAQGDWHRVLIQRTDFGEPGIVRVEAADEDPSVYEQSILGVDWEIDEPIAWLAPAILQLMDIPILRDSDDDAGFYAAVAGMSPDWPGATLYQSLDAANYDALGVGALTPMGKATSVLAGDDATTWDDVNTVSVVMQAGELSSSTDLAVLNGENAALLGDEIIQFVNVTDDGDGHYTLSRLLRGRRGTDYAMGAHVVGERFVLLESTVQRVYQGIAERGFPRWYKAPTIGLLLETAVAQSFTNTAIGLKPLSPVHVTGERAGDELTISWVRRTRIGGGWADGSDVPIGEEIEYYEIDILDGASVVRTLTSTSTSVVYSAADQTTDFGSPQAAVDVVVYQMSTAVGRGFGREATI